MLQLLWNFVKQFSLDKFSSPFSIVVFVGFSKATPWFCIMFHSSQWMTPWEWNFLPALQLLNFMRWEMLVVSVCVQNRPKIFKDLLGFLLSVVKFKYTLQKPEYRISGQEKRTKVARGIAIHNSGLLQQTRKGKNLMLVKSKGSLGVLICHKSRAVLPHVSKSSNLFHISLWSSENYLGIL